MTETVVLRMGSMGDIILAAPITRALGPVTFVTHARWADLVRRLPGVVRVVAWPDDPLPVAPDRVVDLQADLRARWLVHTMQPAHATHIHRHDWTRRARVWLGAAPAPRVVHRYAQAAGIAVPEGPWLERSPPAHHIVLVPGAKWATKRWPATAWVSLGRRLAGPVVVLGGPDDGELVDTIARGIGPDATPLTERGFDRTFATIGSARAVVAGDTGLMHLAGAMGVPLVALFGPTTSVDGFWCHAGRVVEVDLPCRPCSRHGSPSCGRGHHACMNLLPVASVHAALQAVVDP